MHREEIRREVNAFECRKRLLRTLSAEEMIRIMFKDYLQKLPTFRIEELMENIGDRC